MSIAVVFALIAFAGVFLFFLGINQMRRAAGGSEDFQARLAAYGVTTAGAQALPQSQGMRDTLNRLFSPAAERMGRGNAKKGKPSVAEQLQRLPHVLPLYELKIDLLSLFGLLVALMAAISIWLIRGRAEPRARRDLELERQAAHGERRGDIPGGVAQRGKRADNH